MNDKSSRLPTTKVTTISVLITALASIAVAFIGIVPQLREKDKTEISDLRSELNKLNNQLKDNIKPKSFEKCNVSGTITKTDGTSLANAEVYLIKASGSENMATTGDAGRFSFRKVEDVPYWIVVRHCESNRSARTLIRSDPRAGVIRVPELVVEYERQ